MGPMLLQAMIQAEFVVSLCEFPRLTARKLPVLPQAFPQWEIPSA